MEALSPTMEEGRLVKWLKNEGDAVKSGEPIAEVETDKAIMELVARGDGVLRKRLVNEGDSRPVGQLVGVIAAPDENIDALIAESGGAAAPAQAPAQATAQAAQQPKQAVAQAEAPAAPQQAVSGAGASAPPRPVAPSGNGGAQQPPAEASANGGAVRSSPLARRLAREQGLDLGQMHGSGPGGRIIKRDIEAALAAGPPQAAARAPIAAPRQAAAGDYEDVALTQIRKTIAKRLSE